MDAAEACVNVHWTELVHYVAGPPLTLVGYDERVLLRVFNPWKSLSYHERYSSAFGIDKIVSELFYLLEITTSTHLQDKPRTYQRNFEARSRNYPCRAKVISITYSECVSVTLLIQYAKGMHRIVLSLVSCPAVPNIATLSHKLHDFRTKFVQNTWGPKNSRNC
jgi:hypothetical protein